MLHESNLLRFVTSRMSHLGILFSILMRQNDILPFIGKEKNEPCGTFYQLVRRALVKQLYTCQSLVYCCSKGSGKFVSIQEVTNKYLQGRGEILTPGMKL